MRVRLGTATRRSSLRVEGGTGDDDDAQQLRSYALALQDAPLLAPAPARIVVVGHHRLAEAVARGFVVQLAAAIPWHRTSFVHGGAADSASWSWVEGFPHDEAEPIRLGASSGARPASPGAFVLTSSNLDGVPSEATVVLVVDPSRGVTVVRHPDESAHGSITAEFVSVLQATEFAVVLAARAHSLGARSRTLPLYVAAHELQPAPPSPHSSDLTAAIGVATDGGTFALDLVAQGPHAVVGGTTGSGKSELLVTWVAAITASRTPAEVTVLLVDFKGGSAFDGLTSLPHCVGLITDLDPTGALRALSSLNAEIRHRERVLRDQGARGIADPALAGRMARLVIVVDEFAAMLSGFPSLHDVFSDIAARGRSLGMHLILCTQRPAGVVRDSLLANCELRLSLRVTNAADSSALIGSPAASTLPATQRGRCYVAVGGEPPVLVQVAHTAASGHRRHTPAADPPARRPWLPPLPERLAIEGLRATEAGVVIGLFDVPEDQAQPPAHFDETRHGPLLVLGSAGAGKSTLLHTIRSQQTDAVIRPSGLEEAWDRVESLAHLPPQTTGSSREVPTLLVLDDLDSLVGSFGTEHQTEFVARVQLLLRDGPALGVTVVASAQRMVGALSPLAPLFAERILLRFSSKQEYLMADGAARDYDPSLGAGAGHWRGVRLQVAVSDESPARRADTDADRRTSPSALPRRLLVATPNVRAYRDGGVRSPAADIRVLEIGDVAVGAGLDDDSWVVAESDSWLSAWSALQSLRRSIPILFDGCSLAEFRSLTRRRELPPPVERSRPALWLLGIDGCVSRVDPEVFHRFRL